MGRDDVVLEEPESTRNTRIASKWSEPLSPATSSTTAPPVSGPTSEGPRGNRSPPTEFRKGRQQ